MSDTPETPPVVVPPFDWCAEAERLRKIMVGVITGEGIESTRQRNGGDEREVRFTKVNLAELKGLIADAEAKCAESQGLTPPRRRFAIQAGGGRRRGLRIY